MSLEFQGTTSLWWGGYQGKFHYWKNVKDQCKFYSNIILTLLYKIAHHGPTAYRPRYFKIRRNLEIFKKVGFLGGSDGGNVISYPQIDFTYQ